MGLQRFERSLERLVEGVFAKAFRSGLQPVELGRRLAREMDLRRTVGVEAIVAPNHFSIKLSPADHERFSTYLEALNRQLVEAIRSHARDERYTFMGPVAVELTADPSLSPGRFVVDSQMMEQPGGAPVGSLILPDGRRVSLGEEHVVIGRLPECDIALADPNVSRAHAEIRRHGNDFVVADLDSTNGTRLNNTFVTGERRLDDGDEIAVGATIIRFEKS